MDNMDLLIQHFTGREGQWLLVGDNGEKVIFKNYKTGIHNSSLTLNFKYIYGNVQIHVYKTFKDNDYYEGKEYMKVYMPEGFYELKIIEFDNVKKLELFLSERLYEWLKGIEQVQGTGLIWED